MRPHSALVASALAGSQSDTRLVVDAWRAGVVVAPDLPVESWRITWDGTRQVHAQAQLTIADPTGELGPWAPDDPLGAGGTWLHCRYRMAAAGDVGLEWLRVVRPDTVESWRIHPRVGVWVSTGAVVSVAAESLTWQARAERFLGPESPQVTASTLGEVARLLDDIIPLGSVAGITDRPVSASVVYGQGRMDAVEDLLATLDATHRMSADGLLDVIPLAGAGGAPWVIQGGDDEGVLVDVARSQDAAELVNAAVSTSSAEDGAQLVGIATLPAGPLVFGGPHGRVPAFHGANLAKTQAAVDADAATYLANQATGRRTVLPVTCLPHPGLQVHDPVLLRIPLTGTTDPMDLPGLVATMILSGRGTSVHPMTLGVSVATDALQVIADRVRRERRR